MANNATLTYTGENKTFQYVDGQYKTTGSKVINDNKFIRVDGGNIMKEDVLLGSYNYQVVNGVMKNLWMNVNEPSEDAAFLAQIHACFAALNTGNEAE